MSLFQVLQKRGECMSEVQFILKRSALDSSSSSKPVASSSSTHPLSPAFTVPVIPLQPA
ncbi:Hypothetical protein FKW44_020544 [Caligus rogercresseyi]|uniref:Uncharacterized protein n=1 Tax=Caligus rogercresseyi TaxID=217165 RepID=A0A7T8GXD2_CALRO|nr:Hypothetical protein FKW44_020544 [Caligus rogercresseyi]